MNVASRSHNLDVESSSQPVPLPIDDEALRLAQHSIDRWTAGAPTDRSDDWGTPANLDLEALAELIDFVGGIETGNAPPENESSAPLVLGRFRIIAERGRGGFGIVFHALDTLLDREVALKIPRLERVLAGQPPEEFVREAQTVARLEHDGIIRVYEVGRLGPIWYIASEYCDGPTLAEWLHECAPRLGRRHAVQIVIGVAEAVHYAHSRGILHLDLKPENILLELGDIGSSTPRPLVADFGLARHRDGERAESGRIAGTLAYMAPEQRSGDPSRIGVGSDVFALGAILRYMLLGSSDQSSATPDDASPERPRALPARIPNDLNAIYSKCLNDDPQNRYESARELASDLRRYLRGEPVSARPVSWPNRALRWYRRRPAVAASLTALALTLLASIVAITALWRRAETNLVHLEAEQQRRAKISSKMETALLNLAYFVQDSELATAASTAPAEPGNMQLRDFFHTARIWTDSESSDEDYFDGLLATTNLLTTNAGSEIHDDAEVQQNFCDGLEVWSLVIEREPHRLKWQRALAMHVLNHAASVYSDDWLWWTKSDIGLSAEQVEQLKEPYAQLLIELASSKPMHGESRRRTAMFLAAAELLESRQQLADNDWARRRCLLAAYMQLTRDRDVKNRSAQYDALWKKIDGLIADAPAPHDCDASAATVIANSLTLRGSRLKEVAKTSESFRDFEQAIEYRRYALLIHPDDTRQRYELSRLYRLCAKLHHSLDEFPKADELYQLAITTLDEGLARIPNHRRFTSRRANTYFDLAHCRLDAQDSRRAIDALQCAIRDYEAMNLCLHDSRIAWLNFIRSLQALGRIYAENQRFSDAIVLYYRSLALLSRQEPRLGTHPQFQQLTQSARQAISQIDRMLGATTDASFR